MEKVKLFWVDSFTSQPFKGSPAPVIIEADKLSSNNKKIIAKELNTSVVTYVSSSNVADFKLEFYTPKGEIDLCGSGTISAFWLIASQLGIQNNTIFFQENNLGIFPVEIKCNNNCVERILMHQNLPEFYNTDIDIEQVSKALDVSDEEYFFKGYPLRIVSTGRPKLFIPIKSIEKLYTIVPNFKLIAEYCKQINATGFHLFAFEGNNSKVKNLYARHFAPSFSIDEDPLTGIAAGALGCYFINYTGMKNRSFIMNQGKNLDKEGQIFIDIETNKVNISRVKVGGSCSIIFTTELEV